MITTGRFILGVLTLFFISGSGFAQQDTLSQYYDEFHITNRNMIYVANVKTVRLHNANSERSYPLINMQAGEKLMLTFDDLEADVKDYQYTVVHYDHSWQEKDLRSYEYMEGFETDLIENYESSLGTDIPYTHYSLQFPTEYLRITKSGNYLLKVFDGVETDDNTIITRRFMIGKNLVEVNGKIKRALTGSDETGYNQQLEITIDTKGKNLINPSQNVKLLVMQNRRWDNARYNIRPTTVMGNSIEYYNNPELVFKSGNEYRHFDTKDLSHVTEYIRSIESTPTGYEVILKADERRTFDPYLSENDLNGRSLIRARLGRDPATEAEYTDVYFFMPYAYPIGLGDFFLIGQLSDWNLNPSAKLQYNFQKKGYEGYMLLKQGYYEYLYGFVEDGKQLADVTLLEGNHFETENEYMVFVYYREPGTFYDQLIGSGLITQ